MMSRMPSDTTPCDAAIVTRNRSQFGRKAPSARSAAMAPAAQSDTALRDMSDRPRGGAPEQALRPEDQHRRHDEVDAEQFGLWHQVDGGGPRQADDDGADSRALDRAEAADDHDREAHDDHADADARLDGDHRSREGAAERREEDAEGERHPV